MNAINLNFGDKFRLFTQEIDTSADSDSNQRLTIPGSLLKGGPSLAHLLLEVFYDETSFDFGTSGNDFDKSSRALAPPFHPSRSASERLNERLALVHQHGPTASRSWNLCRSRPAQGRTNHLRGWTDLARDARLSGITHSLLFELLPWLPLGIWSFEIFLGSETINTPYELPNESGNYLGWSYTPHNLLLERVVETPLFFRFRWTKGFPSH